MTYCVKEEICFLTALICFYGIVKQWISVVISPNALRPLCPLN
jgi:hypothetical protein